MPEKPRRYSLKEREARATIEKARLGFKIESGELLKKSKRIEVVEEEGTRVFLFDGRPMFAESCGKTFPTLRSESFLSQAPKAVVDMGAIKYVCNGADIMAPGIVRFVGEFKKGDFLLIVDEKYGKPLAIGEALCNSDDARIAKKGPVIENRHFVGDQVWGIIKALAQ